MKLTNREQGDGLQSKVSPNKNKTLKVAVLTAIISILLTGGICVSAVALKADDIIYNPSNSEWKVDNAEDALNNLYELSANTNGGIFDKVLDINIMDETYDYKKTYTKTYTVNIKDKYPEVYDKLTIDNFISDFSNSQVQAQISGDGWVASYVSIGKTYTDGVLTITVSFSSTLNLSGKQGCYANIYLAYISQ